MRVVGIGEVIVSMFARGLIIGLEAGAIIFFVISIYLSLRSERIHGDGDEGWTANNFTCR